MTVIDIARLHARYHVADPTAIERFERALADVAAALDAEVGALADAHAVCIRVLRVDVELDPRASAGALARTWAAAIARALDRHVAAGDDVVVYRRRADVLVDVVRSLARGDHARAWAWEQAGAVPAGTQPAEIDVAGLLVADHADALAVLGLARDAVARVLDAPGWQHVAAAVARAVGAAAPAGGTAAHPVRPDGAAQRSVAPVAGAVAVVPAQVWAASGPDTAPALAALALAVVAPAWLRDAAVLAQVVATAERTARAGRDPTVPDPQPGPASSGVQGRSEAPARTGPAAGDDAAGEPARTADARDPAHDVAPTLSEPSRDRHAEEPAADAPAEVPDAVESPLASRFGGVWFLVHGITELDLPATVGNGDRSPGWVLGRAVARLAGAPLDDPSIGVLTGVPVEELLDDRAEASATAEVDAVAAQLDEWLRARLGEPADEPLDWLWARSATLDADAAWVEVTFLLDGVDVRIRRAGLDLDPGFVWWRGAVVRFRYV